MVDYLSNPMLGHPNVKFYIVCCTDLHAAVGPFLNVNAATDYALELNDEPLNDGCVFFPVPFQFTGEVTYIDDPPGHDRDWRTGGYL